MSQVVNTSPDPSQTKQTQPPLRPIPPSLKSNALPLLLLSGLLLILFSSLAIKNIPQAMQTKTSNTQVKTQGTVETQDSPFSQFPPANAPAPPLQLPGPLHYVLYEQGSKLYAAPTNGDPAHVITTPGYIYNRSVPPVVTQSGQVLYSGNGIWLANILGDGNAKQIATLPPGQVITSMILSRDNTTLAWSSEPLNGNGTVTIYAGSLSATQVIYQQNAANCPCFRLFSFYNSPEKETNDTLLLTDDRGDHHAVRFGLWTLNWRAPSPRSVQPLLDEAPQQGPLAFVPSNNLLLYSNSEETVPLATDESVPDDVAALNYPNSLSIGHIEGGASPRIDNASTILPNQPPQSNIASIGWVSTPTFSPDQHTLVYVLFSTDAADPFHRHSALYLVKTSGSGTQLHISKPQLLTSSSALFLELGAWFNDRIVTLYADGKIYALDIYSGTFTQIVSTGKYAQVFAVVNGQNLPT